MLRKKVITQKPCVRSPVAFSVAVTAPAHFHPHLQVFAIPVFILVFVLVFVLALVLVRYFEQTKRWILAGVLLFVC